MAHSFRSPPDPPRGIVSSVLIHAFDVECREYTLSWPKQVLMPQSKEAVHTSELGFMIFAGRELNVRRTSCAFEIFDLLMV